tara:strand:- start:11773 stop:12849 length:1077 start_codon:yes stop_codon:yes gene_type:complete
MPAVVALISSKALATVSPQSSLAPASDQAQGIAVLWWAMLIGSCLIFFAVMTVLALGLWRARRGERSLSPLHSRNLVLGAGVAVPLAVVIALVGGSLLLGRDLSQRAPPGAQTIEVIGWRWWWEVRYLDGDGQLLATTANEIHVPVDRPVRFLLRSGDVIHSFWVPNLHGKTDMVPGTTNRSWFTAREVGSFRGQCAEFCGTQHALMGFEVIVLPQNEFDAWLLHQAKDARTPATAIHRRGRETFVDAGCANCHTIRGVTPARLADAPHDPAKPAPFAGGDAETKARRTAFDDPVPAPDLTHFGSRRTLAAAGRPLNRGHLAGWISDPQGIKPGALMPPTLLEPQALDALTSYLLSLE